ncbi:hypothetical protein A3709_01825 [Halioglobus sp. HI00S01]|uniref:anti-phage defense-associated sirtuin Dsr1 n=1 Tax=Halioglobus sp. HI00S01 TaxID=1822214 RepID=UPI0007C2AB44|nr:anti-phage defense-associated sirtuin Dsr1 [Halioglobus sp. HI00S01]KZX58228.1 hypothetical protein A3709_01825 [Halioglobus sp. HI00S01]
MQFVKGGPDIPERLLQAHEEGRVVFFCGAGVSYPARLPDFWNLVHDLYSAVGVAPSEIQQAALKAGQLDTAVSLLEDSVAGGRKIVRPALASLLQPDLGATNATKTHEALLTLARDRHGSTRLITSNFDRLFEEVIESKSLSIESFQAPLLPVPKRRWDGLVYVHGLLSADPKLAELDRLVISSGDFGLAYLTERWAARFVSDLFKNFTICFVGYSINDPVLRYMMDALAADRLLGESPPEMFAFGSYSRGKEEDAANEWRSKNVTPILYKMHNRHAYLHKTLWAWADTYRDGVRGKERIVVNYAQLRPMASTRQDDFVGRLIWALSESSGLPARQFADHVPVPSLDWLEPLSEDRFEHSDLWRFKVTPNVEPDTSLHFSLTDRPAPYSLTPNMALVGGQIQVTRWDEPMRHIARWLLRHLNDPKLLLWLSKHGGYLHEEFLWLLERRLSTIFRAEADGNKAELDEIAEGAPNAIPGANIRVLWGLLLAGKIRRSYDHFDLYSWKSRFVSEGLSVSLRFELRRLLTPLISVREPLSLYDEDRVEGEERMSDLVNWEIELSTRHVHHGFEELEGNAGWQRALPTLLDDFASLLMDCMMLMHEVGDIDEKSDRSYIHQPSISKHSQNRDFRDWTALIELTRDAWVATAEQQPSRASQQAAAWIDLQFPLFKRLALFAATWSEVIRPDVAMEWLLSEDGWWLWSTETQRESFRLTVHLVQHIEPELQEVLEMAICAGPPREMFRPDIEPERWDELREREIWLRLAKITSVGVLVGEGSRRLFEEISVNFPEWRLSEDERDEFPMWMGDGSSLREFASSPRSQGDLVEWLRSSPEHDPWQGDDWRDRCRDDFFVTSNALKVLADEGVWPKGRWREALQAWSDEEFHLNSWQKMGLVVEAMPEDVLLELSGSASWWLQAIAKVVDERQVVFFSVCQNLLALDYEEDAEVDDPVSKAINHPVGHVTEAILRYWYEQGLEDNQGLIDPIRGIFTSLSNLEVAKFGHARVLLSAHVIPLFRVDKEWTVQHVTPLLDWDISEAEAKRSWEGFLWSPRLYRPLLEEIKSPFLATAGHYESLGSHAQQYAAILTFASLEPDDVFSRAELAEATGRLPHEGLIQVASTLVRAVEGAGDQRGEYWTNRVMPYLQRIWPKTVQEIPVGVSESLARLCISAEESFPLALSKLRAWMQAVPHPNMLIRKVSSSGLSQAFPRETLDFLDLIVGEDGYLSPEHLRGCLDQIVATQPELQEEASFVRLDTRLRQQGVL